MFKELGRETQVRFVLLLAIETVLALLAQGIFDLFVWPFLLIAPTTAIAVIFTHKRHLVTRIAASTLALVAGELIGNWWSGGPRFSLPDGDGLRQLVSTEWPSPATHQAIGIVALLLGIIDLSANWLNLRRDLHLAPLGPITLGALAAVATSAPGGPRWGLWIIGTLLCLGFSLFHPQTSLATRTSTLASDRSLFASVALAGVAIALSLAAAPNTERSDPRQLDDPTVSAPLIDPIEATIAMRDSNPTVDLFRLQNRSILEAGNTPTYWRTTALSRYDGQRWLPDSALRPIGYRLATVPDDEVPVHTPLRFTIELMSTQLDVLPFPGQPLSAQAPISTDADRVIVQLREPPAIGTTIEAESLLQPQRSDVEDRRVATQQVDEFAGTFSETADRLAGDGTDIERLDALEATMREEWLLDPSQPGAGQQFALIERFVRDTQRGTQEQFATGFALLTRALGFESRVATGFILPPEQSDEVVTLTTKQAAVWPEVRIEELGWIRFDPTPPDITEESDAPDADQRSQSPAAPQPPIAPPVEQATRATVPPPEPEQEGANLGELRRVLGSAITYSAIVVLPIVAVVIAILGFKELRRRRRLRSPDPGVRVRAAWANTTDSLVDAGMTIGRAETNLQIADAAKPLTPLTPGKMNQLAALSNDVTFGNPIADVEMADHAIEISNSIRTAMGDNMGRWQRFRWRLSLRSLRRRTRSPVLP